MEEKKDKRKSLSVKVSQDYAAAVWDFAYSHKMCLSDLIRAALNEYMDKYQEDRK